MTTPQFPRMTKAQAKEARETLARLERYDALMMQSHDRWATTHIHRVYTARIRNLRAALRRYDRRS